MKKIIYIFIFIMTSFLFSSCQDYLDIVPEGVPSMENAFSNRENSRKFLYTCYSYLPNSCNPNNSAAFLGGDELWIYDNTTEAQLNIGQDGWNIGRGLQNTNSPLLNFWDGKRSGTNLWIGIRDCNIFLENIHKPQDLDEYERVRWTAEVKLLKAYYHFYLLRLYGPIPIMDENIDVNAGIDVVRVFRDPVDDVTNYIAKTIDECLEDLPLRITNEGQELGRLTQPIALAIKAQTLMLNASPLFNGNTDYVNVKDSRGILLFSQEYDAKKMELAAQASLAAIYAADSAGHILNKYIDFANISDATRLGLDISTAVSERWNKEIIFATTHSPSFFQQYSTPSLSNSSFTTRGARPIFSVTMNVCDDFYTSNGVPMSQDNSTYWTNNYISRYEHTVIPNEGNNKYYMEVGDTTAKVHLNREPRFYANIGFDRSSWYVTGNTNDTSGTVKLQGRFGGFSNPAPMQMTGYLNKKIVGIEAYVSGSDGAFISKRYSFPIIRLADLYLMYAEALNETMSQPNAEVYKYIDLVRERAGLTGVVDSWTSFSNIPNAPKTKAGMREIIRQERLNELSCEGQRFWDKRRWKIELNEPIRGWNIKGETADDYYQVKDVFQRLSKYTYKDYLWPLSIECMQKNPNFIQNPGW